MSALAARATRHPPPVWRPAPPRSEPQPPLRRTRRLRRTPSGDSRCTKRSGSGRPRRASLATSIVGGSTLSGSIHRSPFRIRCARRVLRSGGSGRSRGSTAARPDVCGARDGGQRAHCARSPAPLLRTRRPASDGTVLLCRSGSRSPPTVASLHRQAPTLLGRCGAGLAHNFRTGSASPQGPSVTFSAVSGCASHQAPTTSFRTVVLDLPEQPR